MDELVTKLVKKNGVLYINDDDFLAPVRSSFYWMLNCFRCSKDTPILDGDVYYSLFFREKQTVLCNKCYTKYWILAA